MFSSLPPQGIYRKAIYRANQQLQRLEQEQLFEPSGTKAKSAGSMTELGDPYQDSFQLTCDMSAYARRLADEVRLGTMNAEVLSDSSNQIRANISELKDMSGHLGQSKRLTSLAYRRRLTSYVLFTLAFCFFFFSCFSIFLSRMPLVSWLLSWWYV